MGLFDKIKKAIDDSGVVDAAKAAVKNFTESAESKTTEEPPKPVTEEKAAEKEVKQTKPKAPTKPACEHGECVICMANGLDKELFFTCESSIKCDKKAKYKQGDLWDKDLMPVLKAYASLKNHRGDWDALQAARRKVANAIIKTYVPELKTWDFTNYIADAIEYTGVKKNNHLLVYFVTLKRKGFQFNANKKDTYITAAQVVNKKGNYRIDVESAEWLYNPSLYDNDEMTFVIEALLTFSDKKWIEEHLLDASVVDFSQFYNEDGTIKRGGYEGLEGDTIYNILKKWCKNNKNEQLFAEEAEKERRMQICDACTKRWSCKVVALHSNCPAFDPK